MRRKLTQMPRREAMTERVCPQCGGLDWEVLGGYRWTPGLAKDTGRYSMYAKLTRHGDTHCECHACGEIAPVTREQYDKSRMETAISQLVVALPPRYQAALPKVISALEAVR